MPADLTRLFLGVCLLLFRPSHSRSSRDMGYVDVAACQESTCPFCCIQYPGLTHAVCADDILHCKLKKRGDYADIQLLVLVVAAIWVGLPLFLAFNRWLLFRKVYGEFSVVGLALCWVRIGVYMLLNCKRPPKSFYKRGTLSTNQTLATQPHWKPSTGDGRFASQAEHTLAKQATGRDAAAKPARRSDPNRKRTKKKSVLFQEDSESDEEERPVKNQNMDDDSDFFAHLSDGLSDDSDYPPAAFAFVPRTGARPTRFGSPLNNNNRNYLEVLHEEVVMEDDDQT